MAGRAMGVGEVSQRKGREETSREGETRGETMQDGRRKKSEERSEARVGGKGKERREGVIRSVWIGSHVVILRYIRYQLMPR